MKNIGQLFELQKFKLKSLDSFSNICTDAEKKNNIEFYWLKTQGTITHRKMFRFMFRKNWSNGNLNRY